MLFITYAVIKNEKILANGQLVLLELAPVDPRSLMQGDYMDLRYKITELQEFNEPQIKPQIEILPKKGYFVIVLDSNNIAKKVRIQPIKNPLNNGEYLLKYHKNNYQIYLGTESYFFQEGTAEKYEKAKYGALKIDKNGNAILEGLYNKELVKLE